MSNSSDIVNIVDYIGIDVLFEVFSFLCRKKLATTIQLVGKQFNDIVQGTSLARIPYFHVDRLEFGIFARTKYCFFFHRMKVCKKDKEHYNV